VYKIFIKSDGWGGVRRIDTYYKHSPKGLQLKASDRRISWIFDQAGLGRGPQKLRKIKWEWWQAKGIGVERTVSKGKGAGRRWPRDIHNFYTPILQSTYMKSS
jgi:hypothetical protein